MKWHSEIQTTEETAEIACAYPNCDWTSTDSPLTLIGGEYICDYHVSKRIEYLTAHSNVFRLADCLYNTINYLLAIRANTVENNLTFETDGSYKLRIGSDGDGDFPADGNPIFSFSCESGVFTLTGYTNDSIAYYMTVGITASKDRRNMKPFRDFIKQTSLVIVEVNALFAGTVADLEDETSYEVITARLNEISEFAKEKIEDYKVKVASIFSELDFSVPMLFDNVIPEICLSPRFLYSTYPILWNSTTEEDSELF